MARRASWRSTIRPATNAASVLMSTMVRARSCCSADSPALRVGSLVEDLGGGLAAGVDQAFLALELHGALVVGGEGALVERDLRARGHDQHVRVALQRLGNVVSAADGASGQHRSTAHRMWRKHPRWQGALLGIMKRENHQDGPRRRERSRRRAGQRGCPATLPRRARAERRRSRRGAPRAL
jgi:hypothetical protein